jgi:hypothetical protein
MDHLKMERSSWGIFEGDALVRYAGLEHELSVWGLNVVLRC